jgi:hypothetical protein
VPQEGRGQVVDVCRHYSKYIEVIPRDWQAHSMENGMMNTDHEQKDGMMAQT